MNTSTPRNDPGRCPLCDHDNHCAMELHRVTGETQAPCWCVSQSFPPALIASLPVEAQGKACICVQCLRGGTPALTKSGDIA